MFASDNRVGTPLQEIIGVEECIVTVEADVCRWVDRAYTLCNLLSQAQGGMHGYGNGEEASFGNRLVGQCLYSGIDRHRDISRLPKFCKQHGKMKRLMA